MVDIEALFLRHFAMQLAARALETEIDSPIGLQAVAELGATVMNTQSIERRALAEHIGSKRVVLDCSNSVCFRRTRASAFAADLIRQRGGGVQKILASSHELLKHAFPTETESGLRITGSVPPRVGSVHADIANAAFTHFAGNPERSSELLSESVRNVAREAFRAVARAVVRPQLEDGFPRFCDVGIEDATSAPFPYSQDDVRAAFSPLLRGARSVTYANGEEVVEIFVTVVLKESPNEFVAEGVRTVSDQFDAFLPPPAPAHDGLPVWRYVSQCLYDVSDVETPPLPFSVDAESGEVSEGGMCDAPLCVVGGMPSCAFRVLPSAMQTGLWRPAFLLALERAPSALRTLCWRPASRPPPPGG